MSKVFIIHGAFGNPEENWIPWLKGELENLGHNVYVPEFPTPENQSLDNWNEVFEKDIGLIDEDTIFVGHSLGPAFILDILERISVKVKGCFFVSGFLGFIGNEAFDSINKSFVDRNFDWGRIKSNCDKFVMYHSDNDPYLPFSYSEDLAKNLEVDVNIVPGAGHFNEDSGYVKFEKLLKDINFTL
ncbi:MAG: alpha/beta hydrolase [Nanoarchaeota archaeon]|jgi:predicted alpha/beta hydrolase family esterase|nr:alpha/beta hydrolase [Nanoarchaeota archaeon]